MPENFAPQSRWLSRRFVKWLSAGVFVLLVLGPLLLNQVLTVEGIRDALRRRLEISFGRTVDVSNFTVSLLGGPRIEANYVTVSEDPRFGHEFFLRADRITASLRWQALLRGRLEFGTLSMLRPSLNVVRNADGYWNVVAWLPPSGAAAIPGANGAPQPRLYRINVDTGRINFKRGPDKHPFALVEVNGSVAQGGGGSWQLDLEARAFRAGAMAQEPGVIRVRGTAGGAQSRIVPANMTVTWDEASVADVLRLTRGSDSGVRGELGAEMRVRSDAFENPGSATWTLSGSALVSGLHASHLPPRATDPALNLRAEATWVPSQARVALKEVLLESSSSTVRASGVVTWLAESREDSSLRVVSPGTSAADLLAIYRAFRAGVSPQAFWEGNLSLEAVLTGWPMRLTRLIAASGGTRLRLPARDAISIGRATLRYNAQRARLELLPVFLTQTAPAEPAGRPQRPTSPLALRFEGFVRPAGNFPAEFALTGESRSAKLLEEAGEALGLYSVSLWKSAGWSVDGAAVAKLRWRGTLRPFAFVPEGAIQVTRATLASPILAQSVSAASFRIEFASPLRVAFTDAGWRGGRWTGTLVELPQREWQLTTAAPRLDAAFARWLNEPPGSAAERSRLAGLAAGRVRLNGRLRVSPQLPSPLFAPLRPEDVLLSVSLNSPQHRSRTISGSLAAPHLEPPAPPLR